MTTGIYRSKAGEEALAGFYERNLPSWPLPYEVRQVPTRHGRTQVVVCGSQGLPALVLLHGSASNLLAWSGDVPEYARHFRVFAVDIPGEPGRSEPRRARVGSADFVEWMDDLLDGLGLPRAGVLGLSMGAWIALRYACERPERVERLALLAPAGLAQPRPSFVLKLLLVPLLGKRWLDRLGRQMLRGDVMPPVVREFLDLVSAHFRPRTDVFPLIAEEDLARLSMPVLLVGGRHDAVYPTEKSAARLTAAVPGAQVFIPETGHALVGQAAEIAARLAQPPCGRAPRPGAMGA